MNWRRMIYVFEKCKYEKKIKIFDQFTKFSTKIKKMIKSQIFSKKVNLLLYF